MADKVEILIDENDKEYEIRDKEALHEDDDSKKYILSQFAHKDPYVRFTVADLQKSPGNTPLVPYIVQTWNTNTIVTGIPNNNEEKITDIDATFVKGDASKKCTLQFIFYIPDNYTISSDANGNVTDVKGTTIRSKDLHGFKVTDNNSKDSHYRVQERGFGTFNVIDIKVYDLKTTEVHNSVSYDRAVIINVKATLGQIAGPPKKDALGFALWINNEDVSRIDSLPWLIVSEPGTRNISDTLIIENKYSKAEVDGELAKKVDETDYKAANGITVSDWKTKLGVPGNTLTGLTDTNLGSTLTPGQVLTVKNKSDGSGQEWVNEAAAGGGLSDPDRFAMLFEIGINSTANFNTFTNTFVTNSFNKVRLFAPSSPLYQGATLNTKAKFTLADNGQIYEWKGNFLGTGSDNHTLTLTSGMYIINGTGYGDQSQDTLITLSATNSNISSTGITQIVRYSNWISLSFNNMMPLLCANGYDESGTGYTIYLKVEDGKTSDVNLWAYQNSNDAGDEGIYLNFSIIKIG